MKKVCCAVLVMVLITGSTAICQDDKGRVTLPGARAAGVVDNDNKGPVASLTVTVPNVVGKSLADATAALKQVGLKVDAGGKTMGTVKTQNPAAGARATKGSTVAVTTSSTRITGINVGK